MSSTLAPAALFELLEAALETPQDERRAYLQRRAPPEQLDSLLSMLDAAEAVTASGTVSNLVPQAALALEAPLTGQRLGPFELEEQLGAGGMGLVYAARRADGLIEQRVAIKLLRQSGLSALALQQFHQERQVLAQLDHPNIARLLDVGETGDGTPYVVMERVDGQTLDAYLRTAQPSIAARLTLFLKIADALDAAHRRLVIHRDLKPNNVLVDATGEPKLLDFGIAKTLADSQGTARDPTGILLMTPSYASPEQLRGEPLGVESDVYAAGLLLYEMLTDERFQDFGGLTPLEMDQQLHSTARERASRRVASARPELARTLNGDLDAIINRATSVEPDRRYPSVRALMQDIERHQQRLPVVARQDSLGYRLSRFLRRNWLPVGAVAIVFVSVIAGLAVALVQRSYALEQQRQAEAARDTAELAVDYLGSVFAAPNPWNSSEQVQSVDDLLTFATQELEATFTERPRVEALLSNTLANVLVARGNPQAAEPLAERTLGLTAAHPELPPELGLEGHRTAGKIALEAHDGSRAAAALERAIALARALKPPDHPIFPSLYNDLGAAQEYAGNSAAAERALRAALELYEQGIDDPAGYATTLSNLSTLLTNLGNFDEAVELQRKSIDALERTDVGAARLGLSKGNFASMLSRMGDDAAAEALYEEAVALLSDSLGPAHPETLQMRTTQAFLYNDTNRPERAAELMTPVLRDAQTALDDQHPLLAYAQNVTGTAYCGSGRFAEGSTILEQSLAIRTNLYGADHWVVGSGKSALGDCLLRSGETAERNRALALLEEGRSVLAAALPAGDPRIAVAEARLADAPAWEPQR
ncbi:MAG: protein kinase [Pseudomonadota bacterium]